MTTWRLPTLNVANYLAVNAQRFPERTAIFAGEHPALSYAGLAQAASRWATYLTDEVGLAEGERVALFLANSVCYIELLCGAWYAGLVVVPINAKLTAAEVAYIVDDADCRVLFTEHDDMVSWVSVPLIAPSGFALPSGRVSQPVFRASHEPAWIFYTSGTTGKPKGATLTHLCLATMSACYVANIETIGPHNRLVHFAPMSHGSGLYMVPYLMVGGAQVIPSSSKFSGELFVETLGAHGHASMFLAPTMIRRVLDFLATYPGPFNPADIHTITYGGGPMYARDLLEALEVMGFRLVQIYGQGESPMTITFLDKQQHQQLYELYQQLGLTDKTRLVPVGQSHPQLEIAIQDQYGSCMPVGSEGEVCVRGDTVMSGYWANPDASRETLREGWLRTGDVGYLDAQGYLYLTDRLKDVIISGGSNIYPREVEEVLLQYPGVREVSVVGRPDSEWGEIVVAFVACSAPLDIQALDTFCLNHMARFKRPKTYHLLDELPKNAYGKILKTTLRSMLVSSELEEQR